MMTFACQGCGAPLEKTWRGPDPKWCSERCRKVTLYAGECVDCGGPTNGYNGPGTAAERCATCLGWTREKVLAAFAAFHETHGRSPRKREALGSRRVLPPEKSVARLFGSWNAGLLAAGLSLNTDRRPETQEAVEAAVRAGESFESIAERYGWTRENVGMRLRYRGTSATEIRWGASTRGRRELLIRLWNAGEPVEEIARRMGYANPKVVHSRIRNLRRAGYVLERRQSGRKAAA